MLINQIFGRGIFVASRTNERLLSRRPQPLTLGRNKLEILTLLLIDFTKTIGVCKETVTNFQYKMKTLRK